MPTPVAFRRAFGLTKGRVVSQGKAHFTLSAVTCGHEQVKRFEKYRFPITLEFTSEGATTQPSALQSALRDALSGTKTVLSPYGNPYSCQIRSLKVAGLRAAAVWEAVRVRSRATPKRAKRRDGSAHADEAGEREAKARHLRVVSSRWTTGHCAACGEGFERGQRIARAEGAKQRGGWAHLACALARAA